MLFRSSPTAPLMARVLAEMTAGWNDVRVIGFAVNSLDEVGARDIYRDLLVRLLLRLRPEDALLLSPKHRARLNEELGWERHPRLVFAILHAWKQVGDPNALAYVRPLAEGYKLAAHYPKIRTAAQECLPVLEAVEAELASWDAS
jgi:hypothetical protein